MMKQLPKLQDFPIRNYDKIRYGDTDRQGHVNNSVFASMLETGRAEVIFCADPPMFDPGCEYVLASQTIDFLAEVTWPGRVEIGVRLSAIGNSSITFEYGLFQNQNCVATASTVIVQIDQATRRSRPLSGTIRSRLEKLIS
jgi:acyl-CoA thioester hydrolase